MSDTKEDEKSGLKHFIALKAFIEKTSTGDVSREPKFGLCLRASIAKCYEFNMLVRGNAPEEDAFFWSTALRGICEDLIVLKYMAKMSDADREELLAVMMRNELLTRVKCQDAFFTQARPQQQIIRLKNTDKAIAECENKIREVWKRNGWPNLNKVVTPQIRQIAEKQGQAILATLYDYLYRLTSGTVHFNVQSLLRSGWGKEPAEYSFSTRNFKIYYLMYGRVYGAYLFCLYFEFFDKWLCPDAETLKAVDEIRKNVIMEPRWPEMVTYEEMNIEPPKWHPLGVLMSVMQSEKKRLTDDK